MSCSRPARLARVDVETELGGHHARELRDFNGVLVHVLAVAGTVLEPAEQLDQLGVQAEDAHFEHGGLAVFLDLLVQLFADLFYRLFDAGGVDAAVADQLFEGEAGDFAADGVEPGEDHDLGRVVDDQLDARLAFSRARMLRPSRPMMRAFMSSLGKRHDGYRDLGRVVGTRSAGWRG